MASEDPYLGHRRDAPDVASPWPDSCAVCKQDWPCEVVRAVDAARELSDGGEWQYGWSEDIGVYVDWCHDNACTGPAVHNVRRHVSYGPIERLTSDN